MSAPATVESTLDAIVTEVDHEWRKGEMDAVRAHLEALVEAVRDEERATAKATEEALAEVLEMHRVRTERLEAALADPQPESTCAVCGQRDCPAPVRKN